MDLSGLIPAFRIGPSARVSGKMLGLPSQASRSAFRCDSNVCSVGVVDGVEVVVVAADLGVGLLPMKLLRLPVAMLLFSAVW